jgi:hypothetical protein
MSTVTLARTLLFTLLPLGALLAFKPVPECHGCGASSLGTTSTGPQGGWNLTISIGVVNGKCDPLEGDPLQCVAEACQSTILVSGTGASSSSYNVCYEQTGAPKYCVTPTPSTDSSGNVNLTVTKRTGCGHEMTYEASGPSGESKATATMECKPCLP